MAPKISESKLPKVSVIKEFINTIDYQDSFSVELPDSEASIKSIYLNVFAQSPRWVTKLLVLRNKIVKPFGLKVTAEALTSESIKIGGKAGIFDIYAITENEIIAGDNDVHLNYRVSVLKSSKTLTVSTLVQYNNWFGKLYFFIVKPFHKLVIKSMLKNLQKAI